MDALLSENTEEARAQALNMFREIERVLSSSNTSEGKYIIITLAENYIFSNILHYFHGTIFYFYLFFLIFFYTYTIIIIITLIYTYIKYSNRK